LQLAELHEVVHKKDSRWSAAQVRTRDRLKQLEQENAQLKSEVEKLKKEKHQTKLVRFAVISYNNTCGSSVATFLHVKYKLHFKIQNFFNLHILMCTSFNL
jgi:uncharacterized protein YlxW (UPF0749 family)